MLAVWGVAALVFGTQSMADGLGTCPGPSWKRWRVEMSHGLASRAVESWVQAFAATLTAADFDRIAHEVAATVLVEVPEVAADDATRDDLIASTRAAIRTWLTRLLDAPVSIEAPPAAFDLSRTLARRGLEIGVLLRIYRVGMREAFQSVLATVNSVADQDEREEVLTYLHQHLSRTVDHVVEALVKAYLDEAAIRLQGAAARRLETTQRLLAGEPVDAAEATRNLGHNLLAAHQGLIVWLPEHEDPTGAVNRLEQVAVDFARAVGAPRPLIVPSGARTLWAWIARPGSASDRQLMDAFDPARHGAVRVALGMPAGGPAGFRSTHREALSAQRVAREGTSTAPVTTYADVELVSCLSMDPLGMRALVHRELGALGDPDPAMERLRATLLAYFTHGTTARAAKELIVHKNTVSYRLQQIERLLGHDLEYRRLHLELALRVAAVYGESVLGTD